MVDAMYEVHKIHNYMQLDFNSEYKYTLYFGASLSEPQIHKKLKAMYTYILYIYIHKRRKMMMVGGGAL